MTPEHFLSMMRNDKARRLLRTTSLDVRMIAAMCGFNDPTYFARWFKKQNGISATGYRDDLEDEFGAHQGNAEITAQSPDILNNRQIN